MVLNVLVLGRNQSATSKAVALLCMKLRTVLVCNVAEALLELLPAHFRSATGLSKPGLGRVRVSMNRCCSCCVSSWLIEPAFL